MAQQGDAHKSQDFALIPGPPVAGHTIQRNEAQHVYVLDDRLIRCSPSEYRILTELLEQVDRYVPYARLIEEPLANAMQRRKARTRMMHVMSKLRSKVWASGLDIVAVVNYGYILVSQVQEQGEDETCTLR